MKQSGLMRRFNVYPYFTFFALLLALYFYLNPGNLLEYPEMAFPWLIEEQHSSSELESYWSMGIFLPGQKETPFQLQSTPTTKVTIFNKLWNVLGTYNITPQAVPQSIVIIDADRDGRQELLYGHFGSSGRRHANFHTLELRWYNFDWGGSVFDRIQVRKTFEIDSVWTRFSPGENSFCLVIEGMDEKIPRSFVRCYQTGSPPILTGSLELPNKFTNGTWLASDDQEHLLVLGLDYQLNNPNNQSKIQSQTRYSAIAIRPTGEIAWSHPVVTGQMGTYTWKQENEHTAGLLTQIPSSNGNNSPRLIRLTVDPFAKTTIDSNTSRGIFRPFQNYSELEEGPVGLIFDIDNRFYKLLNRDGTTTTNKQVHYSANYYEIIKLKNQTALLQQVDDRIVLSKNNRIIAQVKGRIVQPSFQLKEETLFTPVIAIQDGEQVKIVKVIKNPFPFGWIVLYYKTAVFFILGIVMLLLNFKKRTAVVSIKQPDEPLSEEPQIERNTVTEIVEEKPVEPKIVSLESFEGKLREDAFDALSSEETKDHSTNRPDLITIQQVFSRISDGILLLDNALRISKVNESFCLMFGLNRDGILGNKLDDIVGISFSQLVELCRQVIANRQEIQSNDIKIASPSFGDRYLRTQIVPLVSGSRKGQISGLMVFLNDATESRVLLSRVGLVPQSPHEPDYLQIMLPAAVRNQLKDIVSSFMPVFIQGEPGTGKRYLAEYIHSRSRRYSGRFATLDCRRTKEAEFKTKLFGETGNREKPLSSGAIGLVELAKGGTLLFENASEVPKSAEKELLELVLDGKYTTVGDSHPLYTDVRIASTDSKSLGAGSMDSELAACLGTNSIELPPLRDRQDDWERILSYYDVRLGKITGKDIHSIDGAAIEKLQQYSWPGNLRELDATLIYAAYRAEGTVIKAEDLPELGTPSLRSTASEKSTKQVMKTGKGEITQKVSSAGLQSLPKSPKKSALDKREIEKTLKSCNWNVSHTAEKLGISRQYLHRKMKQYAIERPA